MLDVRKQQVLNKIAQLTQQARTLYGADAVPAGLETRFDLRGRTAGQACWRGNNSWMRFNVDMMANSGWDHLYNNTVPHELAHIICMHKGWDRGHGPAWRRVCIQLGGDGQRCHSEEVTYAKGKTYYYTTSTGQVQAISVIRHRKIQQGAVYHLRGAGGHIDRNCRWTTDADAVNAA